VLQGAVSAAGGGAISEPQQRPAGKEAQQLWEVAGQQVPGSWQAAASGQAELQALAGGAQQLAGLLQAPVPMEDASRLWQQYLQAAGCEGSAPSFEEVVLASKQAHLGVLRPEAAEELQQQLQEVHRQYLLRNMPEALMQPAGQAAGGAAGLAALLGQADPGQLLLGHLRGVEANFGIERRADSELGSGSGSASSTILQTLQPLAKVMARMMRAAGQQGAGSGAAGAAAAAAAAAGPEAARQPVFSDGSDGSDGSEDDDGSKAGSGSEDDDSAWQELLQRAESGALAASSGAGGSGSSPAYLQQYGMAPDSVPPPYPGARKLLRWQQTMMLHAAAALAEHPLDRVVRLHVNAAELQQEVGLSEEGLQHVLRIAGKR
jgi:hypothetical protein